MYYDEGNDSFQSHWDWLSLELKEYVLAMAETQHNIDSVQLNRQWKEVTSEILLHHKYKEARR